MNKVALFKKLQEDQSLVEQLGDAVEDTKIEEKKDQDKKEPPLTNQAETPKQQSDDQKPVQKPKQIPLSTLERRIHINENGKDRSSSGGGKRP